jgi:hypothetical protein
MEPHRERLISGGRAYVRCRVGSGRGRGAGKEQCIQVSLPRACSGSAWGFLRLLVVHSAAAVVASIAVLLVREHASGVSGFRALKCLGGCASRCCIQHTRAQQSAKHSSPWQLTCLKFALLCPPSTARPGHCVRCSCSTSVTQSQSSSLIRVQAWHHI